MKRNLKNDKETVITFTVRKRMMIIGFTVIFLMIASGFLLVNYTKSKEKIVQSNKRDDNVLQVKIVNDYINIRKIKNVDSTVIGKVYKNEIYNVLSEDDTSQYNWIEIKTNNGIKGFISGQEKYVIKLEPSNRINDKSEIDNSIQLPSENKENQTKSEDKNEINNNIKSPSENKENQTKLEDKNEIIAININNWQTYFEIFEYYKWIVNDFNEITGIYVSKEIKLKQNYEKVVANNTEIIFKTSGEAVSRELRIDYLNRSYFIGDITSGYKETKEETAKITKSNTQETLYSSIDGWKTDDNGDKMLTIIIYDNPIMIRAEGNLYLKK